MPSDKDIAGSSYVISFYQEVQLLTHNYGNYINLMLEVHSKYGGEIGKIDDQTKDIITQNVQLVRLGVMKTYIQYKSIYAGAQLKNKNLSELEELYNRLKNEFVINREALEKYVILLNSVLVDDVIRNLLVTGQDLVTSVFNNA